VLIEINPKQAFKMLLLEAFLLEASAAKAVLIFALNEL
jgi:hypothetical protein